MNISKYLRNIMASIAACIIATACTHNNGNIGDWFGEWLMESVEINGTDDASYNSDVVWKFQNNIVEMVTVYGHSHDERYGTWSESADELILDFTHSDDLNEAGTGKYAPPAQTYLPAAIVSLRILKLSPSEIVLSYRPDASAEIVYTLRKRG